MGKRAYKSIFGVDYLFEREIYDLKEVDDFVVGFLDRFLINLGGANMVQIPLTPADIKYLERRLAVKDYAGGYHYLYNVAAKAS